MNRAKTEISPHKTFRGSREALLARAVDEPDLTWRVLLTLNIFRLLLAGMLLTLFFAGGEPRAFGDRFPTLFSASAAAYMVFAGVFAVALKQRWTDASTQSTMLMIIDICAVTALMYTSGGVASGLGGLLAVFVGAGSLVLPVRLPAIMAAAATFGILGSEVFTGITDAETNYPAAGILCAIIFAMALAARPLAKRIQMSEALAQQRGVDLKNLSELNEYNICAKASLLWMPTTAFGSATHRRDACWARAAPYRTSRSETYRNRWMTISIAGGRIRSSRRTKT